MHNNSLCGEIFGYVGSKFVTLNVGIDATTGSIALYRGGWDIIHLIGMVDSGNIKIRIMNRGWFKTKVLIEIEEEPMLLETGNKFGDVLRKIFE